MDQHKQPWIEAEVLAQLNLLLSSREASYPNSEKKKSRSLEASRLLDPGVESGELRLLQNPPWPRVLQIEKLEPPPTSGQQTQFITGELSDSRSLIKCEFRAYKRGITDHPVGKSIQFTEYDLVVKGSDGSLFWRNSTFQKKCDHSKAARKRDMLPGCSTTSDLNRFPAPTPELIFRIHRFKFITSEIIPTYESPSSIMKSKKLKQLLNRFPSQITFMESCKSNNTDNSSDGDATEIRSQICPTPKKNLAQNKPFSKFDDDISQTFATQAHQNASQREISSSLQSSHLSRQKEPHPFLCGQSWAISSITSGTRKTDLSSNNKLLPNLCEVFTAGSCEESSSSNPVSSGGKKKPVHSCGFSQDTALPLPLSPVLCLHPGWGGVMGVTEFDVTIPKDQLAALELESAWYPKEEHPSAHFEDALVQCTPQPEPVMQSSSPWTSNHTVSDTELPWSPSPPLLNFMPPDSSALQPPETCVLETTAYKESLGSNPSSSRLGREPHTPYNSDQYCISAVKKNRSRKTTIQSTEDGGVEFVSPTSFENSESPKISYANPEFEEFSFEKQATRKIIPGVFTNTESASQRTSCSYAGPELNQFVSTKEPTPPLSQRNISNKKYALNEKLAPQQTHSSIEISKIGEIPSFSELNTVEEPNCRGFIQNGSSGKRETGVMCDSRSMTEVTSSQTLVRQAEEKRNSQERLSIPAEENAVDYYLNKQKKESQQRKVNTLNGKPIQKSAEQLLKVRAELHEASQESTLFSSEGVVGVDPGQLQTRGKSVPKSPGDGFELSVTQFVASLHSEEESLPWTPNTPRLIVEGPRFKVTTQNSLLLPTAEGNDDEEIPHEAPMPFLPRRTSYTIATAKNSKQLVDPSTLLKATSKGNTGRRQCIVGGKNFTKDAFISITEPVVSGSPNHTSNTNDNNCMLDTFKSRPDTPKIPPKTSEYPSTTPSKQETTVEVEVTPYPPSKIVAQRETYSVARKLSNHLSCDTSPGLLSDGEIIPGTASDTELHPHFAAHKQGLSQRTKSKAYESGTAPIIPSHFLPPEQHNTQNTDAHIPSRFKRFAVVVPVHKGAKRKHDEQVVRDQSGGRKKLYVRKLGFSSQETEYKDINQLVQEHKKKFLEGLSTSEKCSEGENIPPTVGKVIKAVDSMELQATSLPREATTSFLPDTLSHTLQSIQPPNLHRKAPQALVQDHTTDHTKQDKKPAQERLSSTQKALKTLLAERERDGSSLCSNITHKLPLVSHSSIASSSLVSRSSQRRTMSIPHQSSLLRGTNSMSQFPLGSAQHKLVLQASDGTESSDPEGVITARPAQQKQIQKTLIPASLSTISHREAAEKITNYAGIQGQDIDILIPGYNSTSESAKEKLRDMRKIYFGYGNIAVQTLEEMEIEEEERQAKLARLKEISMSSRKKAWWGGGDTPTAQYDRKLGALLSVRRALEEKGGGVTRVELERLRSGDIVKNLRKL